MSADDDFYNFSLDLPEPGTGTSTKTLLQKSLSSNYPNLFVDFQNERSGNDSDEVLNSSATAPSTGFVPAITENITNAAVSNLNLMNYNACNVKFISGANMQYVPLDTNAFLVGYHINNLGEVANLIDHQGVGVQVCYTVLDLQRCCS